MITNFKIFEKRIEIDFPDHLIKKFKKSLKHFFKDENIKNKDIIIDKLIKKFAEDVIDEYFYPSGQGNSPLELYDILQIDNGDDIDDAVSDLLKRTKDYREIILKDNEENMIYKFIDNIINDHYMVEYEKYQDYIDAKKYNL